MTDRTLLRAGDVMRMTGLRRTSFYAQVARGEFPPPVRLSENGRAVAWRISDVEEWIDQRPPALAFMQQEL